MSKKSRLRGPIDKEHGKWDQTLFKSAPQQLYHIYWLLLRQLNWKNVLLLTCKILGLFANRLAANDKYSVLNRVNLTIPVEMQLSQKQKNFSQVFSLFLNSSLNFEHFEKKDCPQDFVSSKLRTPKTWLDKCLRSPFSEDP